MATVVQSAKNLKLYNELHDLERKEKRTYEALAALIQFLKGGKKKEWPKMMDFSEFKKAVLAGAIDFNLNEKSEAAALEPKFNFKHYERAILCASDATYRDMAIQAASKDLTQEALVELMASLRRDCQRISRQVKELTIELRKSNPVREGMRQLWQNVVEPAAAPEEEPNPVRIS